MLAAYLHRDFKHFFTTRESAGMPTLAHGHGERECVCVRVCETSQSLERLGLSIPLCSLWGSRGAEHPLTFASSCSVNGQPEAVEGKAHLLNQGSYTDGTVFIQCWC